ncbi:MAG: agmatinase family protein [Acidimicrobiia bacterium]|nr:MAG: agmatinase family protein [Acidimicrobiia bacterium]
MSEYRFASFTTFAGVPQASIDSLVSTPADVAIVGAPIDWGTTHRAGARFGPRAIRGGDYLGAHGRRPHLPTGIDPLAELRVVDVGDVEVAPGYLEDGLDKVAGAVERIAASGAIPIVLGGDHSVTYANGTGLARVHGAGRFGLVHFDAHADTGETHFGALHGHGTPMRRLIESGAVPGHRFVQVGLRGYWPDPPVVAWMAEQGMRSYLMAEIVERGLGPVVDDAVASASSGDADGVFLSIDIDVVDPGMAPGTGTPEPGGLTSRELLDTVRRLARELPILGADVVEVSPPYDGPGQVTAFLANRVVLEILNGMAERRLLD